eukprot:TRINITY_DN1540_c0_g1_i3.p1 TRINITY_DN1540_c0_g1~~TRINITY_DN1540_c0_g1_i3.p1  ORF type:complete len:129 (+),score=11.45 TRINITY_DN1540_c0_g1_i3:242-628(+)
MRLGLADRCKNHQGHSDQCHNHQGTDHKQEKFQRELESQPKHQQERKASEKARQRLPEPNRKQHNGATVDKREVNTIQGKGSSDKRTRNIELIRVSPPLVNATKTAREIEIERWRNDDEWKERDAEDD